MKAVTCKTLQEIDQLSIEEFLLPGSILMEVAGYESYLFLKNYIKKLVGGEIPPAIIFFIGSGNNGGDGLVMARHLFNNIYHCSPDRILVLTDLDKLSRSELNRKQLAIIHNLGIPLNDYRKYKSPLSLKKLKRYWELGEVILVDALLGIGAVSSPARGSIATMISLIEKIRIKSCSVISLDIPSGIFYDFPGVTDSKLDQGPVVTADITLTYGLYKDILYYPQIRNLAGEIHLLNPGFPPSLLEVAQTHFTVVDRESVSKMIVPYRKTDYKKTRGRVGVVAGKRGMLGAAFLATQGAWKAGSGLVTLFAPSGDRAILTRSLPHTMVYSQADLGGYRDRQLTNDFDVLIFGPGLGREEPHHREMLREVVQQEIPVVIDADGLYHYKAILDDSEISTGRRKIIANAPVILTPHLGEIRHLLGGVESPNPGVNPWRAVEKFFKHYNLKRAVVVMKSHLNYIISRDSPSHIVEGNNPLIGVGGSGDVLAGIIGGLTARQLAYSKSNAKFLNKTLLNQALLRGAITGSYIHQEAGRLAKKKYTLFTSKELLSTIPTALSSFLGQ